LTLPLLTFIYTSSEGWLLAFYEIQILSSDMQMQIPSIIFLVIFMIYYTVFFLYLIRELNVAKQDEFEQNIHDRSFSFYITSMKKSILARNLPLILIFRKALSSYMIVFQYDSPEVQVLVILISFFIFWFYILGIRPFQLMRYNIFSLIVETEVIIVLFFFYSAI
jgi:hypothetical protein